MNNPTNPHTIPENILHIHIAFSFFKYLASFISTPFNPYLLASLFNSFSFIKNNRKTIGEDMATDNRNSTKSDKTAIPPPNSKNSKDGAKTASSIITIISNNITI